MLLQVEVLSIHHTILREGEVKTNMEYNSVTNYKISLLHFIVALAHTSTIFEFDKIPSMINYEWQGTTKLISYKILQCAQPTHVMPLSLNKAIFLKLQQFS
jgi:hypothetical protein